MGKDKEKGDVLEMKAEGDAEARVNANESVAKADDDKIDDDYDEEEDEDYDPNKKEESQSEDEEIEAPDYSNIETSVSQVKTRNQLMQEKEVARDASRGIKRRKDGMVEATDSGLDFDSLFKDMRASNVSLVSNHWKETIRDEAPEAPETKKPKLQQEEPKDEKVKIEMTYTFAGKLVSETKFVDAGSAEAKAYLNSTQRLGTTSEEKHHNKSFVMVMRPIKGTDEMAEVKIKLKRPSLIDKFLSTINNKNLKLSTLEKSRLDWASFVDSKRIKDELAIGNRGGFLEKQDFLGRLQSKRDEQYQEAKEKDRQRRWQQQQNQ